MLRKVGKGFVWGGLVFIAGVSLVVPALASEKATIRKKETTTIAEVETSKNVRERTVRGNEPLTPDQQAETVDSENVFSRTWRGFRNRLAEKGVQIDPVYKGEIAAPLAGGIGRKTTYEGNFDLKASVNAEKLVGWKGGTVFIYGLFDHGGQPSAKNVGDAQGVSNIEVTKPSAKIYELWAQQALADEKVTLLAGLHDLNSEFYVTETSSIFLNSSFGIGRDFSQTGVNGPSIFPVTALAIRARYEPTPSFYLQTAVFDAIAGAGDPDNPRGTHLSLSSRDGTLTVMEAAYLPNRNVEGVEHGKFAVGTWSYSKTFDHQVDVDGSGDPIQDTSHGVYLLGEHTFLEKYSAFVRFGKASSSVNQFSDDLGLGIVATGLIPSRSEDHFGLAMTQVRNGREYRLAQEQAGTPADATETTYEAIYRLEFKRGLALSLDYQYVKNPSTDPSIEDAQVALSRFEIAF